MSEEPKLVGKRYQELYTGYYSHGDRTAEKRQISAMQSVDCMIGAVGGNIPRNLLDVGAGDGNVLAQLNSRRFPSELYAVEISGSGVEAIRSRQLPSLREVQLFDGYKIPYPDKHFDLAMAVHVLEHVEHERLFLREMSRVARRVFIEVPLEHGFRIQRSIDSGKKYGHINFYTKETLCGLLDSCGLRVIDSRVVASSLKYEQHLYGRVRGRVKSAVRSSALALLPALAPWLMVYNAYAYCECE